MMSFWIDRIEGVSNGIAYMIAACAQWAESAWYLHEVNRRTGEPCFNGRPGWSQKMRWYMSLFVICGKERRPLMLQLKQALSWRWLRSGIVLAVCANFPGSCARRCDIPLKGTPFVYQENSMTDLAPLRLIDQLTMLVIDITAWCYSLLLPSLKINIFIVMRGHPMDIRNAGLTGKPWLAINAHCRGLRPPVDMMAYQRWIANCRQSATRWGFTGYQLCKS